MEFEIRYLTLFLLFLVIDGFEWCFCWSSSRVHFDPSLFLLYINNLDDAVCDIAIYADDTTHYSKCDQISDLWQQHELASELESDL